MNNTRSYFYRFVIIISLFASGATTLLIGQQVHAFSASDNKIYIAGDNTFYAYVVAGEKVSLGFNRSLQSEADTTGIKPEVVTITVDAPGAPQQTCIIPADVGPNGGCGFDGLVAVKTGIWRINFQLPSTAYVHTDLTSKVHWGGNAFSWHIDVSDSSGKKTGRLWSELYSLWQPLSRDGLADFVDYYISEDGYMYRATVKGYNGGLSTLSADAVGVVKKGTCITAYQSIQSNDPTMETPFGSCGGSYKLFFEQPSDDLPTTAARWDGTQEWIRPAVSRPIVDGLRFTPDKNPDAQSGTISYSLKNFVGQYGVKIDTNGDGNYDGPEDITLHEQIKNLASAGTQKIQFNGNDHATNAIPRSQQIGIMIYIAKAAEIHLVSGDLEGREGGIELVRLSGDNTPSSNICWDDTKLSPIAGGIDTNLQLDGTACPDSTGGVHAWRWSPNDPVTWGDRRNIDDWAYASAKVSGTAEITYPTQGVVTDTPTKRTMNIGLIIGGCIIIGGIIGGIFYLHKRRRQKEERAFLAQRTSSMNPQDPPADIWNQQPRP